MSSKIEEIEGIGEVYGEKLRTADIKTVEDLLNICCDTDGRRNISEKTGLTEAQLLKWSHMADLMTISGIGPEYSELLEAAGVATVKDLRRRVPAHLAAKMKEINEERKLTRAVPSEKEVTKWVDIAKDMDERVCESGVFIKE
ncbi:DUF4332 domain-containing protein [Thermodesulfobacteriota bacterium]